MGEIEMDDYRAERQQEKRKLVCRIKRDAEKKSDKYWYEYQVSGSTSTERTARKYEDLITVCELALRGLDDECSRCRVRRKNGQELIKKLRESQELGERTISISDAINMIDVISAY